MRAWMLVAVAGLVSGAAWASDGRYQAFPLIGDSAKGAARAFILDTREGHVWVWSENELIVAPDGVRRYGSGFVYQGKLRPGGKPGEFIDPSAR